MLCRTNLSTQPQCLHVCIFVGKCPLPVPGPCPPLPNGHIRAEVNTQTVCPCSASSKATVHAAISTLPPETLNYSHESLCNSKVMPGEEQRHHHSGAPPDPIPAAADQTSIHWVLFQRLKVGHTAALMAAPDPSGGCRRDKSEGGLWLLQPLPSPAHCTLTVH